MSPAEFAANMQSLADSPAAQQRDWEAVHSDMDDLICILLNQLGYSDGVAIFTAQEKWYA